MSTDDHRPDTDDSPTKALAPPRAVQIDPSMVELWDARERFVRRAAPWVAVIVLILGPLEKLLELANGLVEAGIWHFWAVIAACLLGGGGLGSLVRRLLSANTLLRMQASDAANHNRALLQANQALLRENAELRQRVTDLEKP